MDVKLNFINNSNDRNKSSVVIFQKNVATNFDELAIAWKVIKNCGAGWNHPFTYPMEMKISAGDSWTNFSPQQVCTTGQLFHVSNDGSGDVLQYVGPAPSAKEVQLRNDLVRGAIDASIFKDGKLLALKTTIAPGQKAVFEFKPTIWIGAVSQIEEGQVINSAILSDINTELSLMGIASADIVMTGGGPGENSTQFEFVLENVQYA